MTNSNTHNKPEAEIKLQDVLWDLLSQWKMVLIVSILLAVAVSAFKYMRDTNSYEAALSQAQAEQQQALLSGEEAVGQALSALSKNDRATVETLVQLQELTDSQSEYLNNSLLMQANPANQRALVFNYILSTNDGVEVLPIADAYKSLFQEDAVAHEIGNAMGSDASPATICELWSMNYGNVPDNNARKLLITIRVVLPFDDIDTNALAHVVTTAINSISTELTQSMGEHSIDLLRQEERYVYNDAVVSKKQSLINSISSNTATIKTTVASLSSTQKAVYDEIINTMHSRDSEAPIINGDSAETQSADTSDANSSNTPTPPSFSAKVGAVGFVIGLVLYVIGYVIFVVARGHVSSESILREYTDSRLLGEFYYPMAHKGLDKLLHSRFVDKRRFASKGSVEEQIARTTSTIDSVCKHASISDVYILSTAEAGGKAIDIVNDVISNLSSLGIKARIVNVGTNVDERMLLPVKNAIYLASSDTKANDVWTIANLVRSYDIIQVGCVYVRGY